MSILHDWDVRRRKRELGLCVGAIVWWPEPDGAGHFASRVVGLDRDGAQVDRAPDGLSVRVAYFRLARTSRGIVVARRPAPRPSPHVAADAGARTRVPVPKRGLEAAGR